jgi:hypothetical protein
MSFILLDVFTQLGLTLTSAQELENRLRTLLVHLEYQNNTKPKTLGAVYNKLDKQTLGQLINSWKQKDPNLSTVWRDKLKDILDKRNWLAHNSAINNQMDILSGNYDSFIKKLQDYQYDFHNVTNDLGNEISKYVPAQVHQWAQNVVKQQIQNRQSK